MSPSPLRDEKRGKRKLPICGRGGRIAGVYCLTEKKVNWQDEGCRKGEKKKKKGKSHALGYLP